MPIVSRDEFHALQTRFIRLLEHFAEERGFKPLHGRILACLLLASTPRSQHEIAQWTGYSLSAVSRALDQLVSLGSVQRLKEPGSRRYHYQIGTPLTSLIAGSVERWITLIERLLPSLSDMALSVRRIDTRQLTNSEAEETRNLAQQLTQLEAYLRRVLPLFRELVAQLHSISSG